MAQIPAQPRLLITVDTELISNFPSQGLWGRVGNEEWGLVRMLDSFRELGIRATFFLAPYAANDEDFAELERAANLIASRGHDLQLHTHPAPAFDRARPRLRDYDFRGQGEIIEFGCQRIKAWVGQRPVLHRAGDWGADHTSLRVLLQQGFRADFSASPWSRNCGLDLQTISGNGWTRIDGLLCGVGTYFRDGLTRRIRRLDLGSTSLTEIADILSLNLSPLILTLHSFSLLRFNRTLTRFAPNPEYINRLRWFCRVARERWGYQTVTAQDAVAELPGNADARLPWTDLPTTGVIASGAGILKAVKGRVNSYLTSYVT